jgi:hypothetical protein
LLRDFAKRLLVAFAPTSATKSGLKTQREDGLIIEHVFKSAVLQGASKEPFKSYYQARVDAGMQPERARLTLARKIANHHVDSLEENWSAGNSPSSL